MLRIDVECPPEAKESLAVESEQLQLFLLFFCSAEIQHLFFKTFKRQIKQLRQITPKAAEDKELAQFVSVVLAETENVWHKIFKEKGATYREPKLVLFSGKVQSACGVAGASTGPFYCPGDEKLYIDLSFFYELQKRFKAPGDFAMAYVIAHEVGHHIQKLTGVMDQDESTYVHD